MEVERYRSVLVRVSLTPAPLNRYTHRFTGKVSGPPYSSLFRVFGERGRGKGVAGPGHRLFNIGRRNLGRIFFSEGVLRALRVLRLSELRN